MKYLTLMQIFILFSIYYQAFGVESDNRLSLDKNFISSTKNFVLKGFENDKEFNRFGKKNSVYKKSKKKIVENFYEKNLGLGVFDYTFARVKPKLLKFIPKEYLSCRCLAPGSLADKKSFFDWCACRKARASTRLYLVFDIINRLSSFDKNKEIVYVSFGSGKLLQDYLIIKSIIEAGFKNININLIDLGYDGAQVLRSGLLKRTIAGGSNDNILGDSSGIDNFLETFCRKEGQSFDEKDSLCCFCKLIKSSKSIKKINSYTTYFDFLQKWGEKKADILLLVDPMKVQAELLQTSNCQHVNHVCVKGPFNFLSEIIFLLPYKGRPEIFYKLKSQFVSKDLNCDICEYYGQKKQCPFLANSWLKYILLCAKKYKSYKDRQKFINALNLCFKFDFFQPSPKIFDEKFEINMSQSQRYSFYDIAGETFYKNSLVYQLDKNQIFFGYCNLLKQEYFGLGYWELDY